jgi:hypothetical protein
MDLDWFATIVITAEDILLMKYKVVKLATEDMILFVNTVIDIIVLLVNGLIM